MMVFRDLDIFDSFNYIFYFYISVGKAIVIMYRHDIIYSGKTML